MPETQFGWNPFFENAFAAHAEQGRVAARVIREDRERYLLWCAGAVFSGEVSGRFRHEATGSEDFPAVGDWAVVEPPDRAAKSDELLIIHDVLPRQSSFTRQLGSQAQVIAANITTVFIVSSLEGERGVNLRRLERYLLLCWESGANPVVILNKLDLCDAVEEVLESVATVAFGVPIFAVSALEGRGLEQLEPYLGVGETVALVGMSGVGKSALTNALVGSDDQATGHVRHNDLRGRHTTVRRELVELPQGGLLMDTPGMRELGVHGSEDDLGDTFGDVTTLAANCRFRDCSHTNEPGCAICAAIEDGSLDPSRYESYLALRQEMEQASLTKEERLQNKRAWEKEIALFTRKHYKER